jgi:2'-5' RNA ligase
MPFPLSPAEGHVRAFFALSLDETSLGVLGRLRNRIVRKIPAQKYVRATPDASLHLTLKFLGELPEARVPEYSDLLVASEPTSPLAVELGSLVAFDSPKHARVLGVELLESTGELVACAQRLEAGALNLGVAAENRAFVPHITLARFREPQDLRTFLEHFEFERMPIHFDALTLYKSELSPQGSKYCALAQQPLL